MAHLKIQPAGQVPLNNSGRKPVIKVVGGDTWRVSLNLYNPANPAEAANPDNTTVTVKLADTQFDEPIWVGEWLNGVEPDDKRKDLCYLVVPKTITQSLRRGNYMFSVRVADLLKTRIETEAEGSFLVEYKVTSDQHSIPYKDGTSGASGGAGGGSLDYVESVNGKTGKVSLSAIDVGAATAKQGEKADTAYQKPSEGIPKSDLTSGVQASLDKADTALQTAPVTSINGETGDVQLDASDVGAVATSDVVAPDASAEPGKAADAKATGDALTYTKEWVETLAPTDRGSNKTYITFKPTGFGARSNFRLKSFTIMSSDVSSYLPSQPVYAKVLDPEATAHAKAVSRPVSVTDTNTNYTFVFDESEELVYNKQYRMLFSSGAADVSPLLLFGVRVYNATEDQDIYYAEFPRMKPITRWVYSYNSLVTGVNCELDSRVPTTRTINNKELSADISLSASDVDALPSSAASDFAPASLSSEVSGIKAKIPTQATVENKLADKQFVNSSIATNTANFLGTYDYVTDLGFPQPSSSADVSDAAIATALGLLTLPQTPTNNDYVFVQIDYTATTPADEFRRFKFNGTAWAYEYTLNNSSFTAEQWAAINSGITSGAVNKLGALPTAQELATALGAKYEKPSGGIPKTDLASGVQASLDKADTAIQTVKVNGTPLTPDANKAVDVGVPVKATAVPQIAGEAAIGNSSKYASENHVHPAETEVVAYRLPADCFPVTYTYDGTDYTITNNDGLMFDAGAGCEVFDVATGIFISLFNLPELTWLAPHWNEPYTITNLKFANTSPTANTWPVLEKDAVFVRDIHVVKSVNGQTGAVVLSASDVGALGNSGDQLLYGNLQVGNNAQENIHLLKDTATVVTEFVKNNYSQYKHFIPSGTKDDTLALLSDIYAAVQQIAPDFTAKAYALNELCTYNGVIYRCKSAYTATAQSAKPNSDTTHWEAKKVSELFLPLTGGEISGNLLVNGQVNISPIFSVKSMASSGFLFNGIINNVERRVLLPFFSASDSSISIIAFLQNLASHYDATSTYELNNLCVYNGKLYRCTTAITTAEAWTAAHWTEATVEDVLAVIRSALDAKAPLDSPAFTGTPTAPTPTSPRDISSKIATTEYALNMVEDRFYSAGKYWQEPSSGVATGVGSGFSDIAFKPYIFGMSDGGYITKLTIKTRASGIVPSEDVRIDLFDASWNLLDSSNLSNMGVNKTVTFTFSGKVPLKNQSSYYLAFRNSSGELVANVGLAIYTNRAIDDYYLNTASAAYINWRPMMEVYSISPSYIPKTGGVSVTDNGAITKYVAATVNSRIVGGPRVSASAFNDSNMTEYFLGRVDNTSNGVLSSYKFTSNKSDADGIARYGDCKFESIEATNTVTLASYAYTYCDQGTSSVITNIDIILPSSKVSYATGSKFIFNCTDASTSLVFKAPNANGCLALTPSGISLTPEVGINIYSIEEVAENAYRIERELVTSTVLLPASSN